MYPLMNLGTVGVSFMGFIETVESGPALRILHDGAPTWGRRVGGEILLESGARLPEAEAYYLAPAEPTKIIAVHLTYRSRVEEYAARPPRSEEHTSELQSRQY